MKNKPKFVYLQTGVGHKIDNFNELDRDFVTWSADKIYSNDLQFLSVDFILARIKEIEEELKNEDSSFDRKILNIQISTLKNILKDDTKI